MKYQYEKNQQTNLFGVLSAQGGIVYDYGYTFTEARRIVACLNADDSLTWDKISAYVMGRTKDKPFKVAPDKRGTKLHPVRLSDDHWQKLCTVAADVVATPRPQRASDKANWQVAEMLRQIADGRLIVTES